jgi:hypothetical protein
MIGRQANQRTVQPRPALEKSLPEIYSEEDLPSSSSLGDERLHVAYEILWRCGCANGNDAS